ncbi:PI-PLCc_GDPD_SF superfamily domain-containing protein [Histoplasma capsulatum G186AR]|nr:PI-PLCc_GDPD_SF superfamily domain-containing protein [Histoplasma capsulatum]QSS69846.1 PI-PLCc_GDPD_SF superfamily domain-containing protein [Histoplasma capsulatum G186AR]
MVGRESESRKKLSTYVSLVNCSSTSLDPSMTSGGDRVGGKIEMKGLPESAEERDEQSHYIGDEENGYEDEHAYPPQSPRSPLINWRSLSLGGPSRNRRNCFLRDSRVACFPRISKLWRKGPGSGSKTRRLLRHCIVGALVVLGLVQLVALTLGALASLLPGDIEDAVFRWGRPGQQGEYRPHWPTDTRGVKPIPCHSHNDYWRPVPLLSALEAGCISVEADIWLLDEDLFVGHTTSSLAPNRTLTSMYIDPLVKILDNQNRNTSSHSKNSPNGVFDARPSQTLVLLIDFKNKALETWPRLLSQLSPLRDRGYLTYLNGTDVTEGPITVVATGKAPFQKIIANDTYRDIFFDAPLDKLGNGAILENHERSSSPKLVNNAGIDDKLNIIKLRRHLQNGATKQRNSQLPEASPTRIDKLKAAPNNYVYNSNNSYYASVSFMKSIGFPWRFTLSQKQLARIRAQVREAHKRGLKVRYWATPGWPHSLRDRIWRDLIREGVDILNVDDLRSAARLDWGKRSLSR